MMNFTLSNQVQIPAVGIGTFMMTPDQAEQAVVDALACGYRMIDTAQAYMNERGSDAESKDPVWQEDIFISTKIWVSQYLTEGNRRKSLELLGTDYIDLMFIHQPAGDFMAGYRKLEKGIQRGQKSNRSVFQFPGEKLKKLLDECDRPHVIQMGLHPYYRDEETIAALAPRYGCCVMAWYPLGHGAIMHCLRSRLSKSLRKNGKEHRTGHLKMAYTGWKHRHPDRPIRSTSRVNLDIF